MGVRTRFLRLRDSKTSSSTAKLKAKVFPVGFASGARAAVEGWTGLKPDLDGWVSIGAYPRPIRPPFLHVRRLNHAYWAQDNLSLEELFILLPGVQ